MFIRHEPCPNCRKLGRDLSGNNLGIYSDHKYCFACGHYEKVSDNTQVEKPKWKYRLTNKIPQKFYDYFAKYGVSADYVAAYFTYCKELDRVVFRHNEFYSCRSLENKPKVLNFGEKPVFTMGQGSSFVVVVEDVISAIKIGNYALTIPLFGSSLSDQFEYFIRKNKYTPVFWLDKDMLSKSMEYRDRFRTMGFSSEVIFSLKDPKSCDNTLITTKLAELPFKQDKKTKGQFRPFLNKYSDEGNPIVNWGLQIPGNANQAHAPGNIVFQHVEQQPVQEAPELDNVLLPRGITRIGMLERMADILNVPMFELIRFSNQDLARTWAQEWDRALGEAIRDRNEVEQRPQLAVQRDDGSWIIHHPNLPRDRPNYQIFEDEMQEIERRVCRHIQESGDRVPADRDEMLRAWPLTVYRYTAEFYEEIQQHQIAAERYIIADEFEPLDNQQG